MTTYLGVDHSLSACGIAAIHVCDSRPYQYCARCSQATSATPSVWLRTVHTAPAGDDPHGWHTARRHNLLVNEVRAMVEGGRTVAAVEERPPIRDAADPTMAAVRAVICLGLYAARVPLAAVHLARVKAYASGTGNATKAHMMQAANVAHQQLTDGVPLPKNADNNACDAFFLALMAYQKYGCTPPFLATPKRIEVVNRVTWPVFP